MIYKIMVSHEELLKAAAPSCRFGVEACKISRRDGLKKAIEYLEKVKGTNLETLELLKKREKIV